MSIFLLNLCLDGQIENGLSMLPKPNNSCVTIVIMEIIITTALTLLVKGRTLSKINLTGTCMAISTNQG